MHGMQAFNTHTTNVYNSSIFQEKAKEASSFFSELSPYVGGRALQLSNMVRSPPSKDMSSTLEVLTQTFSGTCVESFIETDMPLDVKHNTSIGLRLHERPVYS